MRLSSIGPRSALWRTDLEAACILAGSIPSGEHAIRRIRDQLLHMRLGPGFGPTCFEMPMVVHDDALASVLPSVHIFVGACSPTRLSSPWLDPYSLEGSPIHSFSEYAGLRADIRQWLEPLSGNVIVCDCTRGENCHALCLRQFAAQFDVCNGPLHSCTDVATPPNP